MVRDINIEISSDYGWEIEEKGLKGTYYDFESVSESPISIGVCKKQDDKIIAMTNPFVPKDEVIKEANELPIFLEECNFFDEYNDYKFKGTFIDALIYIQNKYIEDKLPLLEELKNG